MAIKQLSIFVENRPGTLSEITETLGAAHIDIRAMSVADTQDFGILRLIVSDPEGARSMLCELGFAVSVTQVVAVEVSDKPGALTSVMHTLSEEQINVEYMYAFLTGRVHTAYVVLRVPDNERASALLLSKGVKLVSEDDIKKL